MLVDDVPDLVERLAEMIDGVATGAGDQEPGGVVEAHAIDRLTAGFDIGQVVTEMAILRDCIVQQVVAAKGSHDDSAVRAINKAIDATITATIDRFVAAHDLAKVDRDRIALIETTERTTAELEGLIENLPAAIFFGAAGRVTRCNRVGLELLGRASLEEPEITSLSDALAMRDADTGERIDPRAEPLMVALSGAIFRADVIVHDARLQHDTVCHAIAAPLRRDGAVIAAVAVLFDVTERRRIEQALRERELEFRTLADNIPQHAWIADSAGGIYWFNQRWFDFTGTQLSDVQGSRWQALIHPDHVRRVAERLGRAFTAGESWEDLFPIRGRDSRFRWFLSRAVPIRDHRCRTVRWFGTHTDVSAQRFLSNASGVLSSSLDVVETLEQIANLAVPDFADWCVVDVIRADKPEHVAIAHSDPARAALAREWARHSPPEKSERVMRVLRTGKALLVPEITDAQLVASARDPDQLRMLRELGVASYIIAPLVAAGRTLGTISLVQTESQHRYGSSELEIAAELGRRAGAAVDNARLYREARDAVRAREEILAIVSHDLRSPLGAIDLAASMLLTTDQPQAQSRKQLEMIRRATNRMQHLVRDLLDFGSLQSGMLTIERRRESAPALLAEVFEGFQELANSEGVAIVRHCELEDATICGDRDRLVQAFGNLIGNAIKFCPPGGTVTCRGRVEGPSVIFSVTDTGPGIPAGELPHVFEPYWSVAREGKKGTGLGLYICKSIIERHGGKLDVFSEQGLGTTFTVTIPLALEDAPC